MTFCPSRYGEFQKYSALGPLLTEYENIKAVTCCLVEKIHHEIGKATSLETSKGTFFLGGAKLILAMSTLPSTTLMLNSFPPSSFELLRGIGQRFTAHFASYIYARIPLGAMQLLEERAAKKVDMAAVYIAGENNKSKHHFHIQLNAVAVFGEKRPDKDYDVMRNLLKTPRKEMLDSCKDHVVFVCASLGEVDHNNPFNTFCLNADQVFTCNATLHFAMNDKDRALWDTMDETTFNILEQLSPTKTVEFWNSEAKCWKTDRPPNGQIRSKNLVHPASTMWIGEDASSSPVNLHYQFRGVENVFLTGGALWPTGGSWNPTCTMTAMAMDLGDRLSLKSKL